MNGFLFLLYAPVIAQVVGFVVVIIAVIIPKSKKSSSSTKAGTKSVNSSGSSLYRSCGNPSSLHDYNIPDYNYYSRSSMEAEMRAHNDRMEQLMREQNRIMIENESRRISESMNRSLAEQFDTRITNIFRNPWDGIL